MKTFEFKLTAYPRVIVPDSFIATLRAEAQRPDSEPEYELNEDGSQKQGEDGQPICVKNGFRGDMFLRKMQEQYPDDDDKFIGAVLANGLRKMTRAKIADSLAMSGLGATIPPISIEELLISKVERAKAAKAGEDNTFTAVA